MIEVYIEKGGKICSTVGNIKSAIPLGSPIFLETSVGELIPESELVKRAGYNIHTSSADAYMQGHSLAAIREEQTKVLHPIQFYKIEV